MQAELIAIEETNHKLSFEIETIKQEKRILKNQLKKAIAFHQDQLTRREEAKMQTENCASLNADIKKCVIQFSSEVDKIKEEIQNTFDQTRQEMMSNRTLLLKCAKMLKKTPKLMPSDN